MRVLVACEESQRVCIAFRNLGHEAYSADLEECSGGHPEWHILGDVLKVIRGGQIVTMDGKEHFVEKWDLLIAHPPCTYLSNAGACRLYPQKGILNEERLRKGILARDFFMDFWKFSGIEKICVENPVPSGVYMLPKCTQIIQPYQFGHPFTKKTCLWLKGLPQLIPTTPDLKPIAPYVPSGTGRKDRSKYGVAKRAGGDSKNRSKTFEGVAQAMAKQWGG